MMIDLALGEAGLTLEAIKLRLYSLATRIAAPTASLTPAATGIDYVLDIPEGDAEGEYFTATFEGSPGVGSSEVWVGGELPPPVTPPVVIIPLRVAGQTDSLASGLGLLRNGVLQAAPGVQELGSGGEPGDYAVTGWPQAVPTERWLLRWQTGGGTVTSRRRWRVRAVPDLANLAVETVVRRVVASRFLDAWLGPALDEKRFCPARVLGFVGEEVSFSTEDTADVAPWTPAEVRSAAGYVIVRLREMSREDDGLTAGVAAGSIISHERRAYGVEFELVVPSKLRGADAVATLENRAARIEALFAGWTTEPAGSSVLSLRNHPVRYPSRRDPGHDDGTYRRGYLTVLLTARVQMIHAGTTEETF